MHHAAVQRVVEHALVNLVDTTADRLDESATTNDSIELQGDIGSTQLVEHQLATEVLLFGDVAKGRQLLGSMCDIS